MLKLSAAGVAKAVAATGVKQLAAGGTSDMQGLQQPMAAWTDGYPTTDPTGVPSTTVESAGYEIRWWSPKQDNQVADLFVFANANDAGLWVREAASTRCRRHAASYPLSQPAGARALVWKNPLGVQQADIFFSRGNRAYRMVEVPPGVEASASADVYLLLQRAQQLACRLNDAGCVL